MSVNRPFGLGLASGALAIVCSCARSEVGLVAPTRMAPETSVGSAQPAASMTAAPMDASLRLQDADALRAPTPAPTLPPLAPTAARPPTRDEELAMRGALASIAAVVTGKPSDPSTLRAALAMHLTPRGRAPLILSVLLASPKAPTPGEDCPVVIYHPAIGVAERVDVPPAAEIPGCRAPRLVSHDDLNGDGIADFVFAAQLPSNRYDVLVSETRAYLSTRDASDAGFAYCFAPALDWAALERDGGASHDIHGAIERAHARRGNRLFACWKRAADAGADAFTLAPSAP